MNKREQVRVAIHRVASTLQPEDLERLAELQREGIKAGAHYGINAQLKAHGDMMTGIEEILDRMSEFSMDEMAHYIEHGYRRDRLIF